MLAIMSKNVAKRVVRPRNIVGKGSEKMGAITWTVDPLLLLCGKNPPTERNRSCVYVRLGSIQSASISFHDFR